ncbi:MAG: FtsX-like permease family protein [Ruminococcus sp.]
MKRHILRKDFLMEIKRNKSRFLSILSIVALGVAFFAGIRAAGPDMKLSADAFYDNQNMMDIQVTGTLGLTEEDVDAIEQVDGVKSVVPSYSADLLCNDRESQYVVKFMSLTEGINDIAVTEGRLPEKSGEILLDTQMKEQFGYQIGDTVAVSADGEEDILETLEKSQYTVVGFGDSPFYLSLERGTSTAGDGKVDGFAVILPEDFSLDAYTELYIQTESGKSMLCYSDAYSDDTEAIMDRIEELEGERCEKRYESVKQEGQEALKDARQEVDDAQQKLLDAQKEIEDGEQELIDGEEKLAEGQQELEEGEKELEENRQQLLDAQKEIEDNEETLAQGRAEIERGYEELNQGIEEYNNSAEEYESNARSLQQQEELLNQQEENFAVQEKELTAGEEELASQREQMENTLGFDLLSVSEEELWKMEELFASYGYQLEEILAMREEMAAASQTLEESRAQMEEGRKQIQDARNQMEEGKQQLEAGYQQLNQAYSQIESNKALLEEKEAQLNDGEAQLQNAKEELEQGWKALEEGEQEIEEARQELEAGRDELTQARQELEEGKTEYEEEKADAEEKIADAQKEIADGEEELNKLEMPKWYILDRNSNQTYVEYEQDAERIVAIGTVFPLIFFLVAALICLTTMTRMVEEGRTQIGILKALGYRKGAIAAKYMLYAFLATAIGSVIGIIGGQKLLPTIIINAYGILYNTLPEALTPIHFSYSVTSAIPAIIATTLAAFLACRSELKEVPAQLMRPEAPKTGRRILLERAGFIWKKLSFSQKSTMRNLFRYKKRFWMTVLGIGGCMGLLLVGFGLRDSIMAIGDNQFEEIRIFSGSLTFEEDIQEEKLQEVLDTLKSDSRISEIMTASETSVDVGNGEEERASYMTVVEDPQKADAFLILRDRKTQKRYHLDDNGVIITEKLAKLLDVKAGDTIYLKEGEEKQASVTITAVAENYFYHYVYITSSLYEEIFNTEAEDNDVFFITSDEGTNIQESIQRDYMNMDGVSSVAFTSDISSRISDMLKSMDTVIYVIVIAAGMLAFVVLYNLNNINICERKRELATLKVLGFYDLEVSGYVLRENIWLTFFGCVFGIFFGLLLHRYVILTAEIDIMMFGRKVNFGSFVLSILLTWIFSALVNLAMYFRLKRINMVESLKSIE